MYFGDKSMNSYLEPDDCPTHHSTGPARKAAQAGEFHVRPHMNNVVNLSKTARIAGTWKHCDGFSDTEFTFSVTGNELSVSVIDTDDGEVPEIYEVNWNDTKLEVSFAAHWSSGRLVKYRVSVGPNKDRLQATVATTWQELWERQ